MKLRLKVNRWKNVEDKLPMNGEMCLCIDDSGKMIMARYHKVECNQGGYADSWNIEPTRENKQVKCWSSLVKIM